MSWGKKIFAFYLLFVIGICFLVYKATNEKVDLVTKDYYEEEIAYQKRIDAMGNADALAGKIEVTGNDSVLLIGFPDAMKGKQLKAEIQLYCPSDVNNDRDFTKETMEGLIQIKRPQHAKGLYWVKTSWICESKSYYAEQKLFFQ